MRWAVPALALVGCTEQPATTIGVATAAVRLSTPADVDPMDGADTLTVRVLDPQGQELATASAAAGESVSIPELTAFGVIDVEITALSGDEVLSAGRTGPFVVSEESDVSVDALFLPVNTAIELDGEAQSARIEHLAMSTPDGRVLLLGGRIASSSSVVDTSEFWGLDTGFGEDGPDLPAGLFDMSSTRFGEDEALLVSGGRTARTPDTARSDKVFLVDPFGGDIDDLPPMNEPRAGHCLAPFQQQAVIAIGGRVTDEDQTLEVMRQTVTGEGFAWSSLRMTSLVTSDVSGCFGTGSGFVVTVGLTDEAWGVMDLRTADNGAIPASFRQLPDPPGSRQGVMMIPLDEHRVLVLAGYGSEARAEGWVIDPQARTISRGAELDDARGWATWAWWEQGNVIAVGGGYADAARSQAIKTVELVDVDGGPILKVDVPLKEPRISVVRGGAIVLTGGVDDRGNPGGAWAIVPWID